MAGTNGAGIARRLNRITVVVGVCLVACMSVSLVCLNMLSTRIDSFISNEYTVASTLGEITRGNEGTGRTMCKMILSSLYDDRMAVESAYKECSVYRSTMEEGLQKLATLESDSVDKESVQTAISEQEGIKNTIEKAHSLCVEGKGKEAWSLYEQDYSPVVTSIRTSISEILDKSNTAAENDIQDKDAITAIAIALIVGTALVLMALLVLMIRRIARSITEPLQQVEQASRRMREGLLDSNITYTSNDELGSLCMNFNASCQILSTYVKEIADFAEAINQGKLTYESKADFLGDFKPIGESLRQLSQTISDDMSKIGVASDQVYRGAEQMSSVGTQLSQTAVEQASSVQELVATINSVSSHVADNAATAETVRDSANALYNSIEQYSQLMRDVNNNMIDTRSMSDKIRGIVRNLEMISFQTNTLALNAAVEAARAGEAGRGFAVIADEIRELASEASQASTNTGLLLGDMIAKVNSSADKTLQAITSLDTILSDGNTTASNVDKITDASKNQAEAIERVRSSIAEMSRNIQSMSSTAEESAASAEELHSQMRMLNQMVDSFEIRK
ncbi:MAG: HAMP domain-containing methyl-accepting chemotaxis protein [Coriobacteriales bacterium]|nr:HAMP domain-containing methyl-accepting chemotaxis protein [Coriobacteriales bacterium]